MKNKLHPLERFVLIMLTACLMWMAGQISPQASQRSRSQRRAPRRGEFIEPELTLEY